MSLFDAITSAIANPNQQGNGLGSKAGNSFVVIGVV